MDHYFSCVQYWNIKCKIEIEKVCQKSLHVCYNFQIFLQHHWGKKKAKIYWVVLFFFIYANRYVWIFVQAYQDHRI